MLKYTDPSGNERETEEERKAREKREEEDRLWLEQYRKELETNFLNQVNISPEASSGWDFGAGGVGWDFGSNGGSGSAANLFDVNVPFMPGPTFSGGIMNDVNIRSTRTDGGANHETPWVGFGNSQLGVTEATGNNDGADVDKYLKTAGLSGSRLPWCGCFVNWSMKSAGLTGVDGPARALNWREFGQSLSKPAYGSIGTLKRPGGGHVGIVVARDADRQGWIIMLGGNQSDAVSYRSFPISIMKFNYPSGFAPSYSLPSMKGIPKGVRMQ